MQVEWDIIDLCKALSAAIEDGINAPWKGVFLYDPNNDTEHPITDFSENKITFEKDNNTNRTLTIPALNKWSALVNSESILNNTNYKSKSNNEAKKIVVGKIRKKGFSVTFEQNLEDLQIIHEALSTDLEKASKDFRARAYIAIKKLENFSGFQRHAFTIGLQVVEHWNVAPLDQTPADILIHLAYYRRWSRRTEEALEVTKILETHRSKLLITDRQKSILGTERAAAFMDLYEKRGNGLEGADRFLRYSMALNSGINSTENHNAWQRFNRLKGKPHY